jgi:ribosomal protein S18 acetylase RimI-like enzyme
MNSQGFSIATPTPMIRPYRPADRDALYAICIRTGDSGRDASALYHDPRILPDIFCGPYLKLEPGLAFVLADSQDRPVGYIIGTADTPRFVAAYQRDWPPKVAGRYRRPGAQGGGGGLDAERIHELHHPEWMLRDDLADYPAHLHIALLPHAQGKGAGRALMDTYLNALRVAGIPGVHLSMSAANTGARAFYDRMGFHQIARPTPARVLLGRQTAS